jgi:hypothetical protein
MHDFFGMLAEVLLDLLGEFLLELTGELFSAPRIQTLGLVGTTDRNRIFERIDG